MHRKQTTFPGEDGGLLPTWCHLHVETGIKVELYTYSPPPHPSLSLSLSPSICCLLGMLCVRTVGICCLLQLTKLKQFAP